MDIDTAALAAITGSDWVTTPANGDAPAFTWTKLPGDPPTGTVAVIRHEPGVWAEMLRQQAQDDGREYVPGENPFTLYYTTTARDGTPAQDWETWAHADDPADLARDVRWLIDRPARP